MYRYLSVMVVGAALFGSMVVNAQDRDREEKREHQNQRFYDKSGRDWHDWNDDENRAYRKYLQEHRKKEHDFGRASGRERNDYFKWRHEHPDSSDRH